jgi:GNAT superfamily N-acetyltransferase
MAWRRSPAEWRAGKGRRNKLALKRLVTKGPSPGILGYLGKQPVGWCAVAPRSAYPFLGRSRLLRPVDDQPVWSVSCLFMLRNFRRRGYSAELLRAAVKFAGRCGAHIVEGYPVLPSSPRLPDVFLWTGVPVAFERAGFREVARRSPTRPILRHQL